MLAVDLELSKYLYLEAKASSYLITSQTPKWMNKIKKLFSVEPSEFSLGRYKLRVVKFQKDEAPKAISDSDVDQIISDVGLEKNEEGVSRFVSTLKDQRALLTIRKPLEIFLKIKEELSVLLGQSMFGIDVEDTSVLPKPVAPHDPLEKLKRITTHPKEFYEMYAESFNSGTCRIITKEIVSDISSRLLANLGAFASAISNPDSTTCFKLSPQYAVISCYKHEVFCVFVALKKHFWTGTFKEVYLGLRFKDSLMPVGVAVTYDEPEYKKEILFRNHPSIGPLLTPLYHEWIDTDRLGIVHGWASRGTLQDILEFELPLVQKDIMVLELLKKMHIFHQHAVHKDLKTTNLLVNRFGDQISLFINDVGSSALRDDEKGLSEVTTNSVFLAPELIRKCADIKGYYWTDLFETDISFDQWLLSERFQVGLLVYEIYTGTSLTSRIQNLRDVNARFPLRDIPFRNFSLDDLLRYKLDPFLNEDQNRELIDIFREAHKTLQSAGLAKDEVQTSCDLDSFLEGKLPAAPKGVDADKAEEEFMKLYSDPSRRVELEILIGYAERVKINHIYESAHSAMQTAYQVAIYEDRARTLANIHAPLEHFFSVTPMKIARRLNVIKALLDQNPLKRPDLHTVRLQLLQVIHFGS